jgi:hypothetical protein
MTKKRRSHDERRVCRYTRFLVSYAGASFESWVQRPGATLREVELEHPLARVSAVPESKYTGDTK